MASRSANGTPNRRRPRPPVTADHTPERLSAEEREALRTSGSWPHVGTDLFVAVEAILAARLADQAARLAAVEAVLADEPLLLKLIRKDMGEGFPNELSERRGRTITGWVDRLRAAALNPDPSEART